MQAWLETSAGKRVELSPSFAIGRAPENQLVLADAKVSRRHALIYQHGAQHWIMDFGSRNGVFVNGRRLLQPLPLHDNDMVQAGDSSWTYRQTGKPRRGPSREPWSPQPQTERAKEIYAPSGHGLIVLDENRRVQNMTDRARTWLREYFQAPSRMDSLPVALVTWLKEPAAPFADSQLPGRDPLVIARGQKQLVVRLASAGLDQHLLLLTEEQPAYSVDLLVTLGLTRREAEVLHWLAEGKTNAEISMILKVSQHTVNKHTEHIFAKLGVENRNRALLAVLDKLGRAVG